MTQYALPGLPYDHSALDEIRASGDYTRMAAVERALAFSLSGHVLHSLFWQNLSPDGGDQPKGELLDAIERDFGGFDSFRRQLTQAAATCMGSGWGALMWDPVSSRLLTAQIAPVPRQQPGRA